MKLGLMQGRLLPKFNGRFQAHPLGYWQKEFQLAKELDLDLIEFILDFNDLELNPLMTYEGINEIKLIAKKTGVSVQTICADYFMQYPLVDQKYTKDSLYVLKRLIRSAESLGVSDIVLPFVDESSLNGEDDFDRLVGVLKPVLETLNGKSINLSLETDLNPPDFLNLLKKLDHKNVKVNYDIGNSAALGYDMEEEFETYGDMISDIHLKDRNFKGGSVKFGEGDSDFKKLFSLIKRSDYKGPLIMQSYRDEEGLEIFKEQLSWIKRIMNSDRE